MTLNIKILGEGFPLVFFHGWGVDHTVWLPLAEAHKNQYRSYLVDLPGFGASLAMDWPQFKAQLLTQLPKQFVVVGWSLGGLFATRLALEASERVLHLINVASSPYFIQDEGWPGVGKTAFADFFNRLICDPQQTMSEFIRLQLKGGHLDYACPSRVNLHALKTSLHTLETWDFRENLLDFNKPTSYFFGRLDGIVPFKTFNTMKTMFPSFNYVLFPKAAHMPFMSHQDEFIQKLTEVLT